MAEKDRPRSEYDYQEALACLECIQQLVGDGSDVARLDPLLMTSFYERLTTNLARLRAAEQHPPFRESLQALLDECQHQQAKILRICRRPPPAKAASAARKDAAVRDGGGDRRPLTAPHRSRLRFSDVAGLEEAKASLAEAVIMPVQFPHLFTGGRRPWTRVLLYGPPGTGKSRLAAAVAGEAGAELFPVSAADLLSSYVGETEKAMSDLFARAASRQPAGRAVLFVDELDGLCRVRSGREEEHTRRLKTHLLQLMDGLLSGGSGGAAAATTFLLAATNCPWDLDPAFLRRFQRRVYVPLPDRAAQRRLIELHLGGTATSLSELDWQQLLAGTDGLSGSDLAELTQHALYQPLRELETATSWRRLGDGQFMVCEPSHPDAFTCSVSDIPFHAVVARDLQLSDFLGALRTTGPSVSQEMLRRYEEFSKGRGSATSLG
ncbi:Vacuolar protein sorting-associated protein 4 [Amphibalanus amphitrite]|uniref:Vacuolar protein sorting-associated protein 4 n=1 Tax=Amphibalanus amphitrite TaxID=1232801 RepID=A0A6A4WLA1_AMPAM|nr:Vacuolar protein sorting-associated protein 4 [Amphibalanus amphitrite]